MGKNIKQIIHVSCLVSLLFTCNKIISKNGTTLAIVPYLHLSEDDATQAIVPYVHLDENDTAEALVPRIDFGMSFSIDEALEKLKKLMKQKEERLRQTREKQATDLHACNEIKSILVSYTNESKMSILDENNDCIGICDTKGWVKDETTKKKVHTVTCKLNLLIQNLKLSENDRSTKMCDTRSYKKDKDQKNK